MWMNTYQAMAQQTAVYPGRGGLHGLIYATLGLAGEAGEVANKVKKILRDDEGVVTAARRAELLAEVGDVLWYVAMLADELGLTLAEVAAGNLDKLAGRAAAGTIQGAGDVR